jgi:hypothetical protein
VKVKSSLIMWEWLAAVRLFLFILGVCLPVSTYPYLSVQVSASPPIIFGVTLSLHLSVCPSIMWAPVFLFVFPHSQILCYTRSAYTRKKQEEKINQTLLFSRALIEQSPIYENIFLCIVHLFKLS